MNSNTNMVVQITDLCRRFGAKTVLDNVNLSIPSGGVFGLIGANGAGKTTLLKHILGTHYAQSGTVRVFGLDPVANPVQVLGRLGYMSENRDIPNWMRVGDLISYTASFYPNWDKRYAEQLRSMFDLDAKSRVRNLSRGQRARTCLLLAIAHRPDLLVLDEPSSGLDPVVRRDILGAIIRTIADEGRTVLFSSHLLDEVERVADRVAILHRGSIQLCEDLETIKNSRRRVTLRFEDQQAIAPTIPDAHLINGSGREWTYMSEGTMDQLQHAVNALHATIVEETYMSLDELFMVHIGQPDMDQAEKSVLVLHQD